MRFTSNSTDLHPQTRSFFSELLQYTQQRNLPKGRALHALIIRTGSSPSCVHLANSLVNLYAKCGHLPKAKLVFESMEEKDVVSWNCLINGFSQQQGRDPTGSSFVMQLFQRMRRENVIPNAHTFTGVFSAASNSCIVAEQAHTVAIKIDRFDDVFVGSSLVNMYCKGGLLEDARKVFDRMPERNSVSSTTMISGYAMRKLASDAFEVFESVRKEETGNEFLFTSMLSALAVHDYLHIGKQIHCLAVKNGVISFVSVENALVTMYGKCGSTDDALRTFESSEDKNSITWSAMITGYAQTGDARKALNLFSEMHFSGVQPSEFTLVGVLNACSDAGIVHYGKQIHGYLLKLGYGFQIFITTALVDMYAKCNSMIDARKGFEYVQEPDIVMWTSMISGCVQNGENEEALSLYGRMKTKGVYPNQLTMVSILKACSALTGLEQGKQIHAHIVKQGLTLETPIGSALSTLYSKCGCFEDGNLVFQTMPTRDVVSWNAIISGLSQNGHGKEAVELFETMIVEGTTKPDSVTFVNVLSACSHMGLVEKGWAIFDTMFDRFGIEPSVEHYACMVDILSRAGKLEEAKEFIESVTIDHGLSLWRILLSGCKNYRKFELGAYAGEKLMELNSQESSAYVLLSSIYTALGRLEDVERVRRLMQTRGVSKEPGCSWVELKSRVHVFVVRDQMHPRIGEIRGVIRELTKQMKDEGYKPMLDLVRVTSG